MKLLRIDGNSIVNRAFFGIKVLTTKDGQYTNAIYGFMNILNRLENELKPDAVAIAFDLKAPTFRHKLYDGYKGTRKGMPDELASQMPILKQLLSDLGYVSVSAEGYEADDILGTLSRRAGRSGDFCYIATGDRDSLQLVNDYTHVILASTGKNEEYDSRAVREKYGLRVDQLIDLKALMGDSSDNIPGVKGVGEKTAVGLLSSFETLDGVYRNINDPSIKKGVREKLVADKDMAYLSRKLGPIFCEVPIDTDLASYRVGRGEPEKAIATYNSLEMFNFAARVKERLGGDAASEEKPLPKAEVDVSAIGMKKAVIYEKDDSFIFVWDTKVRKMDKTSLETRSMLEDESVEKIAWDSKALYRFCLENGIDVKNITFSIVLAAYLENPLAAGYTIGSTAASLGVESAFRCELEEAPLVQGCYEKLRDFIEKEDQHRLLYDIEMPLSKVLRDMEYRGFMIDREGLIEFGVMLKEQIAKDREDIYEMAGERFNLNSPKQLGHALFDTLGLPAGKKTKSGYSTDAETLEGLRDYHPIIDKILNYRTYQKLNSTYVEGFIDKIGPDGRIHSTFNQTEARTGRISSSEPNLQNIPVRTPLGSEMRKFFIADEGCVLLDADYSQIELRILAHISGDKVMQEAFINGDDIHARTAARVMKLPIEMVTPELRSRAKAVNFGIVYGIGAFSLSKDIGTSVKEAREFINDYLHNFSGVAQYRNDITEFAMENGYVTTMYNRKRMLPEIKNSNRNVQELGKRMALNTPIQGTSADIIKIAMVRVYDRLKEEGLKAKLILQVHDELIVESPVEEADRASEILSYEMQNAAKLSVPLKADVNQGKNWYVAKG